MKSELGAKLEEYLKAKVEGLSKPYDEGIVSSL